MRRVDDAQRFIGSTAICLTSAACHCRRNMPLSYESGGEGAAADRTLIGDSHSVPYCRSAVTATDAMLDVSDEGLFAGKFCTARGAIVQCLRASKGPVHEALNSLPCPLLFSENFVPPVMRTKMCPQLRDVQGTKLLARAAKGRQIILANGVQQILACLQHPQRPKV